MLGPVQWLRRGHSSTFSLQKGLKQHVQATARSSPSISQPSINQRFPGSISEATGDLDVDVTKNSILECEERDQENDLKS